MVHKNETAIIYTILHFLVDFTTIFLVSNVLLGPTIGMVKRGCVIILYNIVAFAGQLPIGIISDALNRSRTVTAIGCILAAIAYPTSFISPWTACALAAMGNGAFHIGAGSDILKMSMPKAGLPGLFVSSGALGVWMAYKANGIMFLWLCPIIMIAFSIFLLNTRKTRELRSKENVTGYSKPTVCVIAAVGCFALTVVIRSLLGTVMDFSWKATPIMSFLFVLALASGKALGGYIGDKFGYIMTSAVSMILAFALSFFAFEYWQAGILAVLCFNMTMPLTLTAIAGVSGEQYGLAFGITTFALAMGFIPVVVGANEWFGLPLLLGGILISLCLLVTGYILLSKFSNSGVKQE